MLPFIFLHRQPLRLLLLQYGFNRENIQNWNNFLVACCRHILIVSPLINFEFWILNFLLFFSILHFFHIFFFCLSLCPSSSLSSAVYLTSFPSHPLLSGCHGEAVALQVCMYVCVHVCVCACVWFPIIVCVCDYGGWADAADQSNVSTQAALSNGTGEIGDLQLASQTLQWTHTLTHTHPHTHTFWTKIDLVPTSSECQLVSVVCACVYEHLYFCVCAHTVNTVDRVLVCLVRVCECASGLCKCLLAFWKKAAGDLICRRIPPPVSCNPVRMRGCQPTNQPTDSRQSLGKALDISLAFHREDPGASNWVLINSPLPFRKHTLAVALGVSFFLNFVGTGTQLRNLVSQNGSWANENRLLH